MTVIVTGTTMITSAKKFLAFPHREIYFYKNNLVHIGVRCSDNRWICDLFAEQIGSISMKTFRHILWALFLFVSTVVGQTISSPDGNPVLGVAIATNGTMYCYTEAPRFDTFAAYKSTNSGQTWIYQPIPAYITGITTVNDSLLILDGGWVEYYSILINDTLATPDTLGAVWAERAATGLNGGAYAISSYGDTVIAAGNYYGDAGALAYSFDGAHTFKIDTTLDSLIYYHYTQAGTRSGFIGSAMTSTGFYEAIQSGVFFSPMDSLLHSWALLPLDTVFLKSKQPYISNGDTLAIAGVQKLVSVNDSVFVFLDVDTLHTATYGNMKTISALVPGGSGTLVWTVTSPDSVGAPAPPGRFPDSLSAAASLKTSTAAAMKKGQYGVSSYSYNSTVVFGTSSGKVIVERQLVTGIESPPIQQPASFTLSQNYPNPFNPTTKIQYSVPRAVQVSLTVYNVLGEKVATLYSGMQKAGSYEVNFNADRFASGVYFCRMEAGGFSKTLKMMLLK